jgi:DNA (cytosine-5)-methyltransferase 1
LTRQVVSLFSGCGGMDLGFADSGFNIVRALDNDPAAVAVYKRNLGSAVSLGDATEQDFMQWSSELGDVDVVLGGFPCQGFSKAGSKRKTDPRNELYRAMRDAVAAIRPKVFVAENVEGLAQNYKGEVLSQIHSDFKAIGYRVHLTLVDASSFGIAQHRRRILFVGLREGQSGGTFEWPAPSRVVRVRNGETRRPKAMQTAIHGLIADGLFALPEPATISDAIGDLRSLLTAVPDHEIVDNWPGYYQEVIKAIGPGQKLCNVRNGPESVRTWEIPNAFGEVSGEEKLILETIARNRRHKKYGTIPNGNPLPVDVIEELTGIGNVLSALESLEGRGFVKPKNGGYDLLGAMFCSGIFKRPRWEEPAPTVLTNFWNPRYFIHPIEDRPFTLREAARLQGFPDDFEFCSAGVDLVDGYRLVGNAVPPPLAAAVAGCVRQCLGDSLERSA